MNWRLYGQMAGWDELNNLTKCCGQTPDCVMENPYAYGLCRTQIECRSCRRRGEIGITLGHAVRNWNSLEEQQ